MIPPVEQTKFKAGCSTRKRKLPLNMPTVTRPSSSVSILCYMRKVNISLKFAVG
jgi:hypothetical protein